MRGESFTLAGTWASWHVDKGNTREGRKLESFEYGVLSIGRGIVSGGGWQPQVAGGGKKISSGIGSQLTGYQVRVFRFGCGYGPEPVPGAEHLNLSPDGRDPDLKVNHARR